MSVDGYTARRANSTPVMGLYKASPSTLSDGEHDELRLTSAGLLRVSVDGSASGTMQVAGAVAHDAADSGNPIKIGGKGSAAVASDVTEGDRVNASFTLAGRLRTEAGGDAAHDAADAGNPLKIGGKGSAAVAADVTEGDRVNASFTLAGRLRTEAGGDVAHDAADAGNPVKVGGRALATLPTALTASDRSDLLTDLYGRLHVTAGQRAESWAITHKPAANTQATATKAAGTAAQRHVCKGFSWTLSSGAGAPTPEEVTIAVRDGATGAGTIVWQETVSLPATAGSSARGSVTDLYIVGTAATAMTIETDSAPGTNVQAAVNLFGETIPA